MKEAQRLHEEDISMGEMAGFFMDLHLQYDFYDPEWKSKIEKAMALVNHNKYLHLDESECPALQYDKDNYLCVWGIENSPPRITKLGKTEEEKVARCSGCSKTLELKRKLKAKADQLKEIVTNGIILDIPSCTYGGRTQKEGDKIELYCKNPKMSARYVSVHKLCKTLKAGANCDGLRWTRHTIKGKLPNPEKEK